MRLSISSTNLKEWSGDVLVVGLPKGEPSTTAAHLESRFPGVSTALSQQAFEGKTGQKLVLNPLANANPQRLVLIGLGDADSIDLDGLRAAAAAGAQASIGCNGCLGLQLAWDSHHPDHAARISAEAVRLSLYADQRFQLSLIHI